MENKILENNIELLKDLKGLSTKELQRKSLNEFGVDSIYTDLIASSLQVSGVLISETNDLFIGPRGTVMLYCDKFSLDLSEYEISIHNEYDTSRHAINCIKSEWLRKQIIKVRENEEFKCYGEKLQKLVDLGFEIEEIDALDVDWEIRIRFKENNLLSTKSAMFFKWPIECLSYLKERFNVNNDLED